MQPSSLVFLLIIAVWAAYFVQYWVRRREHLATARSVDQFSESMRVLERRSPLAQTAAASPAGSTAGAAAGSAGAYAAAMRSSILSRRVDPAPAPAAPEPTRSAPAASERRQPAAAAPFDPALARRTRAVVMLGALSTVVVAVTLVSLGLLPLLTLAVPVVCVASASVWARRASIAQRRRTAPISRSQARPARQASSERVARPARPAAERPVQAPPVEREVDIAVEDGADEPHVGRGSQLYDVQAVEAAERQSARPAAAYQAQPSEPVARVQQPRPLVDEDDIPLTWDPVPVPRPTYTMKSRATRPAPTAADLVGDADTEYAAYDEPVVRRVAGA